MGKNVQIPQEVFIELCKAFLADYGDYDRELIENALQAKLDSLVAREEYSKKINGFTCHVKKDTC